MFFFQFFVSSTKCREGDADGDSTTIVAVIVSDGPLGMQIGRWEALDGKELVVASDAPIVRLVGKPAVFVVMDDEMIVGTNVVEGFAKIPKDESGDLDGVGGLD